MGQIAPEADGHGARVEGRIGVHRGVQVFMKIWLGFACVMALANAIAFITLRDPLMLLSLRNDSVRNRAQQVGTQAGESEEAFLLDFVTDVLGVTDQQPATEDSQTRRAGWQ